MKRKFAEIMIAGGMAALLLSGCGAKEGKPQEEPAEVSKEQEEPEAETPIEEESQPEAQEPQSEAEEEFDTAELFTGWLPQGAEQVMAETEPNEKVKEAIASYYEIPEEYWGDTRYYYNYVDLNGDGREEIFAVAMGSYVSGSGGSSAIWLGEDMEIRQAFTLVNTPILVTEDAENGGKKLILQRLGGGAESETVVLTCENGVYTNVADAEPVENLEELTGQAIISNDLIRDMEEGTFLTLAD